MLVKLGAKLDVKFAKENPEFLELKERTFICEQSVENKSFTNS